MSTGNNFLSPKMPAALVKDIFVKLPSLENLFAAPSNAAIRRRYDGLCTTHGQTPNGVEVDKKMECSFFLFPSSDVNTVRVQR